MTRQLPRDAVLLVVDVQYSSELLHDVALADLNGEFSTVIDTTTVLAAI